jgi:hypothetical protein
MLGQQKDEIPQPEDVELQPESLEHVGDLQERLDEVNGLLTVMLFRWSIT